MDDLISRAEAIDAIYEHEFSNWCDKDEVSTVLNDLPAAQPDITHCKDCKHWMPYDWMFSEVWQSQNMDDYPEKEIGCQYCDMSMGANDFCSKAERRLDG